jgi:hypothetical protein
VFYRNNLISLRRKALRKGIWFKVLDQAERALIDLTIRVVDRVQSKRLVRVLLIPVRKLREAMKSLMDRAKETGRPLAEKLSRVAQAWGNVGAGSWVKDELYATYLGLSILNKPVGFYV